MRKKRCKKKSDKGKFKINQTQGKRKKIAEKFIDIRFLPQIKDNGNEKK